MKLTFDNILNKHKNIPCVVALHGPSLDKEKDKIELLQKEEKILRISVNEWYDYFDEKPNYWVVSNGEFTIEASINGNSIWDSRGYPREVFNKYDIPLFYNATADFTSEEIIDRSLKCDYLSYDTRHFRGHSCIEILKNFKSYYEKNENLDFTYYGNNSKMWERPNIIRMNEWMKKLYGRIGGGWNAQGHCCENPKAPTLQEKLQQLSGHEQHMSPGHTVGLFAAIFAVLMGCNPIYVTGLDLDCSIGYAEGSNAKAQFNAGHIGHWKTIFKDFLLDDMRILNESAKLLGIEIINLNKNSWHNELTKGELKL